MTRWPVLLMACATFWATGCADPQQPATADGGTPMALDCAQVGYHGLCEGRTAVFCYDGVLERVECPERCGWVDDETGYYCGGSGFAPAAPMPGGPGDASCDALPAEGRCDGDVRVFCQGGVRAEDCAAYGLICGWFADAARYDCLPPEPAPQPEPAPAPQPEPEPAPQPEPEPEPAPQPEPEPAPQPEPEPEPEPEPQPPADRLCYSEPFHDGADLGGVRAGMGGDPVGAFRLALRARWPAGEALTHTPQAFLEFLDPRDLSTFLESGATVMHESTHGFHADNGLWQQRTTYYLRDDLRIAVDIVPTPARSLIAARLPDDATRIYRDTYLFGEQGSRGFFDLLEELNCYVNDLATYAAFGDAIDVLGISGRDGAVSFFLYLQIYLHALRTEQPAIWAQLQQQAAVRRFVDVEWRRMHFWLAIADRYPQLGINDGRVRAQLYQPARMDELSRFVGFGLEAGPCRARQPGE